MLGKKEKLFVITNSKKFGRGWNVDKVVSHKSAEVAS